MKKKPLVALLKYLKPYRVQIVFMIIFAAIYAVAALFTPVVTGMAVDCIKDANNVDFDGLKYRAVILAALVLVAVIFQWLMSVCAQNAAYNLVRDMRKKAFDAVVSAPVSFVDGTPHGDIVARISSDTDQIADGVILGFTQLFTGIITIAGTLAFMFSLNVTVALAVVIVTPISLITSFFIAKANHKYFTGQAVLRGNLTAITDEAVANHDLIGLFNYADKTESDFDKVNADLEKTGFRAMFGSAMINPTTRFINNIVYVLIALFGAIIAVKSGGAAMTVGTLTSFLLYANQYAKPFNEISGVFTEMQTSLASAARVIQIADTSPEDDGLIEECKEGYESVTLDGGIEFDDMSFSYVPSKPLIENLNLNIEPGTRVAIVGPTGCGKTTLINLLMRFYDPVSGSIIYDGKRNDQVSRRDVRTSVGMVLQDSWIFRGTVHDNIAYSKPDATREEVKAAAVRAHIDGFISRLENGYDTIIDDDDGISQGQKQLICIARIMLINPSILILDEATSNIDARTEIHVQHAFRRLTDGDGRKKTCFVVAHRLSTILNSDLILVMNGGKIVERGTHESLMQRKGFYYDLYNSQFAGKQLSKTESGK